MSKLKILYAATEIDPFLQTTKVAEFLRRLPQGMQEMGMEIRIFVPRFGIINERKNRLHEVVRLSGINIAVGEDEKPLIIKVASIPNAKLQVYFIDNEDYFKRKQFYIDDEEKPFGDNDERAMFFARGVIETIKKLNWVPDVIHLNGWMASFIPVYLKTFYKNDSYFNDSKLVLSVYNEENLPLSESVESKMKFDNITGLKAFKDPSFQTFVIESMGMVDMVLKGDEFLEGDLDAAFQATTTEKSEYIDATTINNLY